MSKPRVVIATPCFNGMLTQTYMLSVMRLMAVVGDQIELSLTLLGSDAMITRARSTLVAKFLDDPQATHLMFVDSDIGFEPEQFARLFRQDKDFTAAMYPIKEIDWNRLGMRLENGEPVDSAGINFVGTFCSGESLKLDRGFATASYAGTGFQLIRRHVFERMIEAYPELKYSRIHAQDPAGPGPDNRYALFDPMIDSESGTYLSEDYAFCKRWRALGGEIWLDLESRLTHVGPSDYRGDSALRYRNMESTPEQPKAA